MLEVGWGSMGNYRALMGCAEAKISQWWHSIRGLGHKSWTPNLNWLKQNIEFIGRLLGQLREVKNKTRNQTPKSQGTFLEPRNEN